MIKILMNLILKNMFYLKNNLFNLLIILLSITHFTNAQSEFVQFHFTDGTQQNYALNEVIKLDFTSSELRLHKADATIISWNYDLIDFYRYDNLETAVNEIASLPAEIRMDVFPNPAKDLVNVHYRLPVQEAIHVTLYSLNGKRIFEQRLPNKQEGIWQYDSSDLPAGSYIVVLQGNTFNISKTMIKQ
jgi:hypothetical protein